MPKLRSKGGDEYVAAMESSYRFTVPLMLHSYVEAIKAVLASKDHRHVARSYLALKEIREELETKTAEADVGLDFLRQKMFKSEEPDEQ